jgi:hypothetical protein
MSSMPRPQEEARDMAYDDSTFRRHGGDGSTDNDPSPFRANGFTAADYRGRRRGQTDADESGAHNMTHVNESQRLVSVTSSGAGAVGVVDDPPPAPGESARDARDSGRDRLGIHLGWEVVLLLATAAVGYLLYRLDPASLRRPALDTLLISGVAIGMLTVGAGLTLRAGVPNLAIGPIAVASALNFAENGDLGVLRAALPAVGIAAAGALAVALIVVAFHVPGWAATLAAAMGVIVYNQLRTAPVDVQGGYDPSDQALLFFGAFAAVAVLGGGLGTLAPIRRMFGRLRSTGDPAVRRGAMTALPVIGSLVMSSVLAVGAGVLIAANSTNAVAPGTGLEWTGLALGLALVAGTSAYGRRGGIFGTLLAVAGMALFLDYAQRRNFDIALFAIAAATVGAGLIVTRLVETYGRPLQAPGVGDDWQSGGGDNWSPDLPETWSPAVPAQGRSDRWGDDRWGQSSR